MNKFNSPQEAIDACNKDCEQEWLLISVKLKLDQTKDPNTYNAAKSLFHTGYMSGARWVSGVMVQRVQETAASSSKS